MSWLKDNDDDDDELPPPVPAVLRRAVQAQSMPQPSSCRMRLAEWQGLLERADGLARGGRLPEALRLYQLACRHRQLRAEHLGELVACLARNVRSAEGSARPPAPGRGWETLACRKCQGFLCEPVSLPCGHTFCKRCLERDRQRAACGWCRDSGGGGPRRLRVNVILSNLLAKWFPRQVKASQLRHEGNRLYKEKKLQAALQKYNEAVRLGKGGQEPEPIV